MNRLVLALIVVLFCAVNKTKSCSCDDSNDNNSTIPAYNFTIIDNCYSIFVLNQTFPDQFINVTFEIDCSNFTYPNNSFDTINQYCNDFNSLYVTTTTTPEITTTSTTTTTTPQPKTTTSTKKPTTRKQTTTTKKTTTKKSNSNNNRD